MNASAADREAVRLALLSAYVVEAKLPPEIVQLLDALSAPPPEPRRRFRLR